MLLFSAAFIASTATAITLAEVFSLPHWIATGVAVSMFTVMVTTL